MKKKKIGKTVSYVSNKPKDRAIGSLIAKIALLAVIVLLCLLPAVFVGGAYGYIPLLIIVFAILASFLYGLILRKQLAYLELSELSTCRRGTDMDFIVEVRNRSFLVFPRIDAYFYISDIFGEIDSVTEASMTLSSRETREFRFAVRFAHIGTYTAGLKELCIYDLLNLFCFRIRNDHRCEVLVNPRVYPFLNLNISETAIYESLHSFIVSPIKGMDYAGVREYVFGDPIKNIHWKLSAHSRNYMTKILESYGTSDVSVVMDLASPQYDTETVMTMYDGIVETALSVCYYAHEYGMDYDLRFFDKHGERRSFVPRDFYDSSELMNMIPSITVDNGSYDATPLVREDSGYMFTKSNIAFVTANINDALSDSLLALRKKGFNVIVFFLIPSNVYDKDKDSLLAPLKRLENARISYYVCSAAEELAS